MNVMQEITKYGHEKILFVNNEKAGLKAIIAVHNTVRGPAIGGCRLLPYASEDDALFDVLRLSRGMSHKNAAAGLDFGGGKSVIIADPSQKTEAMFEAFGDAMNALGGCYITVEDVNTTCDDALIIARKTKHICGLPHISGDPSPFTSIGVYQGIKATAKVALGSDNLSGVTVAVQGVGKVGLGLVKHLAKEGANIIVADKANTTNLDIAVNECGATVVSADEILSQKCDIFAPCALGAIVNPTTIPNFNCKAVAGAANNVILDLASGEALKARGILYAPDFIINAGGVINAAGEAAGNYNEEDVLKKVYNIYNTVERILTESQKTGEPEGVIAERFAEECIWGAAK